jgi:hypothetical protein
MSTLWQWRSVGGFSQPEKRSGELEESGGLEDDGSFNVVAMRVDVRAGLFYGWVVSTEG